MEETATPNCPATQDFEARVREHQAGVRAFIRALGADEAWVDDLAQEVFIVAHRRLNQFEPGTDFGKTLGACPREEWSELGDGRRLWQWAREER